MTPLEASLTVFGVTMGFIIPVAIAFVIFVWAANKWIK
jgi:F0F1-type ATP synthase membrane subunit b/b'